MLKEKLNEVSSSSRKIPQNESIKGGTNAETSTVSSEEKGVVANPTKIKTNEEMNRSNKIDEENNSGGVDEHISEVPEGV